MIKLWRVKISVRDSREKLQTIGVEDDNHNIIPWKYWVTLDQEHSFYHLRKLSDAYGFMETLLRIGSYSVSMKRDDGTKVYESNIIGLSPYMLSVLTGYERRAMNNKLMELRDLGYIEWTPPERGGYMPEINLSLNQYTAEGAKVFTIQKNWLLENLIVNKDVAVMESEDRENFRIIEDGTMVVNGDIGRWLVSVNDGVRHSDRLHANVQNRHSHPEWMTEDAIVETQVQLETEAAEYEGASMVFVELMNDARKGGRGDINNLKAIQGIDKGKVKGIVKGLKACFDSTRNKDVESKGCAGAKIGAGCALPDGADAGKEAEAKPASQVDTSNLSTTAQMVVVMYEKETGLQFKKTDLQPLEELLRLSHPQQIISAIKSQKVWRAGYPANFAKLPEPEQKKFVIQSQPGYWLKAKGMAHVLSFVSNSFKYRKDRLKGRKTELVSGLDEQRVHESQKKIVDEIRRKQKEKLAKEKLAK